MTLIKRRQQENPAATVNLEADADGFDLDIDALFLFEEAAQINRSLRRPRST